MSHSAHNLLYVVLELRGKYVNKPDVLLSNLFPYPLLASLHCDDERNKYTSVTPASTDVNYTYKTNAIDNFEFNTHYIGNPPADRETMITILPILVPASNTQIERTCYTVLTLTYDRPRYAFVPPIYKVIACCRSRSSAQAKAACWICRFAGWSYRPGGVYATVGVDVESRLGSWMAKEPDADRLTNFVWVDVLEVGENEGGEGDGGGELEEALETQNGEGMSRNNGSAVRLVDVEEAWDQTMQTGSHGGQGMSPSLNAPDGDLSWAENLLNELEQEVAVMNENNHHGRNDQSADTVANCSLALGKRADMSVENKHSGREILQDLTLGVDGTYAALGSEDCNYVQAHGDATVPHSENGVDWPTDGAFDDFFPLIIGHLDPSWTEDGLYKGF
ncbi:hypothetical protein P154DRAFT_579262 [Amniculicola lignicola CBS 123094]|uniref:Uncharacterized protein n=1 Tax=Amniculicola lignicola CBS 123094 TaxID=1392246 RepID=A0A6A5W8G3_9PLEO|nr:hypothetical protein P154DRAFT_579262 [Amniculicola lignicola CBS 123094]